MNNNKTIIVTDSACDINPKIIEENDIRIIPLRIISTQREYRDQIDITHEELYSLLEKEIPKTSLPLPEDVEQVYNKIVEDGYENVLHISMSSGLSGTYNMINIVTSDFKDRLNITVFDSKTLSAGLGIIVERAALYLNQGLSLEETVKKLEYFRSQQLGAFIVKTLEYLRRGGRIGLVEGVVGSLLQIKPVIYVNDDGVYETLTKARGSIKAKKAMLEQAMNKYSDSLVDIYIVHAQAIEEAKALLDNVSNSFNVNSSNIVPVSPVLGIHTGPGLLGLIIMPVE